MRSAVTGLSTLVPSAKPSCLTESRVSSGVVRLNMEGISGTEDMITTRQMMSRDIIKPEKSRERSRRSALDQYRQNYAVP